jgi:hypothetical protein
MLNSAVSEQVSQGKRMEVTITAMNRICPSSEAPKPIPGIL